MASKILLCLIACSAVFVGACARKDSSPSFEKPRPPVDLIGGRNQQDGGQDGGGGTVNMSTDAEVKAAIRLALKLATEPDYRSNIFYGFWLWKLKTLDFGIRASDKEKDRLEKQRAQSLANSVKIVLGTDMKCIVPRDASKPDKDCDFNGENVQLMGNVDEFTEHLGGHFRRLIKKSKVVVRDDGDCGSNSSGHSDASVTALKPGADLCFSVPRLRRVPPSALRREILSLLYHEASHLSGFGEADAREQQSSFLSYLSSRFGDFSGMAIINRTNAIIGNASRLLRHAESLVEKYPGDSRITGWMGRFADSLAGLPSFQDTVALRLIFNAETEAQRRAVNAYSISVLSLLREARKELLLDANFGCIVCGSPISPEKVGAAFKSISNSYDAVIQNWHTLQLGNGPIVCKDYPTLRDTDMDRDELLYADNDRQGYIFLLTPETLSCR
jgi:hypothetical protein